MPPADSATASHAETILQPLNPEQRTAAEAVTGPVCIVAGAGTGKTTTVTHRIAWQVASGAVDARSILAVTFTQKAAGELRSRLGSLGVAGVEARTFHSAALWMLQFMWAEYEQRSLPRVLANKYSLIAPLWKRLPRPYCFRPLKDVVSQVEWGANRMLDPHEICASQDAAGIEPALPDDLLRRVIDGYAHAKDDQGVIDFEDVLSFATHLLSAHPAAGARIRDRFTSFTVDEYQDVNPLQQALLNTWLGDRDDLCVVGDDHQTIFTFTGASADYLLDFDQRFANAQLVTLTRNYRSTPEVLALANDIADRLPGRRKELEPTLASGPAPVVRAFADADEQAATIASEVASLHHGGTALNEIAILYRTNDQSTRFEQALTKMGLAVYVKGRGLMDRDAWRQLSRALHPSADNGAGSLADLVTHAAHDLGYDPAANHTDEEAVRQRDLTSLIELAEDRQGDVTDVAGERVGAFHDQVRERFSHENDARGVQLMTLHAAKGLEFDAVFMPELINGVLPYGKGKRRPPIDDERRLFFVGVTRAKRHLWLTHLTGGKRRASIFLVDAGLVEPEAAAPKRASKSKKLDALLEDLSAQQKQLFEELRKWRLIAAQGDPAYTVLSNKSLVDIARQRPVDTGELMGCHGVGSTKISKYGDDILRLVAEAD